MHQQTQGSICRYSHRILNLRKHLHRKRDEPKEKGPSRKNKIILYKDDSVAERD
jgi:hypothetical protein